VSSSGDASDRSECAAAIERGRVRSRDLAPGDRYFSVYSPTGVCVYTTRSEDEAQEIVARNPDRLSYMGHTR